MIVEAHDPSTGDTQYFEVNFPAKNGAPYQFVWRDGRRRVLEVRHVAGAPADADVALAAFDAPSHEIIVQSGR
jgi:hypothetical protein